LGEPGSPATQAWLHLKTRPKQRFPAAGRVGRLSDNALAAAVNVNFVLHAGQFVLPF
jgi:hypothetical protein